MPAGSKAEITKTRLTQLVSKGDKRAVSKINKNIL
jgi:hypothetical protein